MNLLTTLDSIKGVGPKTVALFRDAGLATVNDLLLFLPMRHEDFTGVTPIAQLEPGTVTIMATCEKISTRPARRGLRLTTAVLADESGKLNAVWFNQPYRTQQLGGTNDEFYFSGKFEYNYGHYQLTNPTAEKASDLPVQVDRLLPVYHSIHGLKTAIVRKTLEPLRPLMSVLPETLPQSIVQQEALMSRSDAISAMHFPKTLDAVKRARDRLAFEELFELLLASALNKRENQKLKGYAMPFQQTVVKDFVTHLPFSLTNAQRRATWDILQDFESSTPMNRLLQGDVGSGKTVVAGVAARQASSHGYQTAIMAPTELLARQHAETLEKLLQPYNVSVGLLIGGIAKSARTTLYQRIESGEVDVIVGTHALIQTGVHFANLGFVVIDEQHRFGVDQRQKLLSKSGNLPHLLAMTATPIPRSLALTVYGELDVSILDEQPKGRLPIKTTIVSPPSRPSAYEAINREIDAGRQVYVVCGLIHDGVDGERKSAETEFQRLRKTIFHHRRICLLHGKMKANEKDAIMQDFKAHKYDIIVSTTVIEVGVDVPNATVMMIEDADQFGLSQLHQLRGRVGRGKFQSYCYLMMSSNNKPTERLREIEKSNDGFYLAEVDMKLRGPGELYGRRQHGSLNLQIATLADTKLIAKAQHAAKKFINNESELNEYLAKNPQITYYQRLTTLN